MTANTPAVSYTWIGYPSNMPEEEQSSETVNYGAQDLALVIRIDDAEDGVALDIKSTGVTSRKHLLDIINGIQSVVQQDYLEAQKESRERRTEPPVDTEDSADGGNVVGS